MDIRKLAFVFVVVFLGALLMGALAMWILGGRTVEIKVTCNVRGATVRVDGEPVGETSYKGEFTWSLSTRNRASVDLSVEKEGYESGNTSFVVERDQEKFTFDVQLSPADIPIRIVLSTRDGIGRSEVWIDKEPMGWTDGLGNWSGEISKRRGERVQVRVDKAGHDSWRDTFVASKPEERLTAVFARRIPPYKFVFTTRNSVGRVRVSFDGEYVGTTDGGGRLEVEKRVEPGQTIVVSFEKPSTVITDWEVTVGDDRTLEYEIRVKPSAPAMVHFSAFVDDTPASGVVLVINGQDAGTTSINNGEWRGPIRPSPYVGDRIPIAARKTGFEVEGIDPGFITVVSSTTPYSVTAKMEAKDTGSSTKEIRLTIIRRKDGSAVSSTKVTLSGPKGVHSGDVDLEGRTNADGIVVFRHENVDRGEKYDVGIEGIGSFEITIRTLPYPQTIKVQ